MNHSTLGRHAVRRLAQAIRAGLPRWAAIATLSLLAAAAHAQQRTSLVVGFPPGGGVDIAARLIADKLGPLLGAPVLVENRPGASSGIAARYVATSKPDGHTIFLTSNSVLINQLTNPDAGYNMERDLRPIGKYFSQSNILAVNNDLPVTKLSELIALSKTRDITYSSPGLGSIPHLATEQLLSIMGGATVRHIPYPGAAPALNSAMGNQVQMASVTTPAAVSLVKAGKLRAIAVTSATRMAGLPDVPTAAESGFPGFAVETWVGVFVPAGTPKDVVTKLETAIAKAAGDPEVKEKLVAQGFEVANVKADAFAVEISDEIRRWKDLLAKVPLK